MSVDMPSNWYSLHPIQGRKSHEALIDRAEHKVAGFMEKILSNIKILYTGNNLYEIILGTLLSLESIVYLLFGRFFLAKLFFANSNYESCMKCAAFCPHNAIEAGHFWGVILYYLTAFSISFQSAPQNIFFNCFFIHTTMTHLSFWGRYREPEAKLKDLSR